MTQKLKIKHSGMARLEWRHLLRVEDGMVTLETLEDAALAEHNAQAMVRLFNAKVKDHQPVHREIRPAGLDAVLIIRWVASLFMGSRLHNRNKAFGVAEGFGGVRPAPSFALQEEPKPDKNPDVPKAVVQGLEDAKAGRVSAGPDLEAGRRLADAIEEPEKPAEDPPEEKLPSNVMALKKVANRRGVDVSDITGKGAAVRITDRLMNAK